MNGCLDLPRGKIDELAERTDETGREHAFVVCDGEIEGEFVGDRDSLEFDTDCEDPVVVFHTHPNDVVDLSDQDRKVLQDEEIKLMCVGDTDGNYLCEGDGYACAVEADSDQTANSPPTKALAMPDDNDCDFFGSGSRTVGQNPRREALIITDMGGQYAAVDFDGEPLMSRSNWKIQAGRGDDFEVSNPDNYSLPPNYSGDAVVVVEAISGTLRLRPVDEHNFQIIHEGDRVEQDGGKDIEQAGTIEAALSGAEYVDAERVGETVVVASWKGGHTVNIYTVFDGQWDETDVINVGSFENDAADRMEVKRAIKDYFDRELRR